MSDKQAELNRLHWHSRRGMLELDVILIPFVKEVYSELPKEDQQAFEKLLACEDQDLFRWLMQRVVPEDPELQRIIKVILARVRPE